MIRVKAQLTYFDASSLSVTFCCWDTTGIQSLRVRDRFGATVVESSYESSSTFVELPLAEVHRSRFPLFIQGIDVQGALTPADVAGPVFPSPTDEQYAAGTPLPRGAINQSDPKIRSLKADAARWSGHYRAHRRFLQSLSARGALAQRQMRSSASLLGLFTAVVLILSALPHEPHGFRWQLSFAVLAGVVLCLRMRMAWKRASGIAEEMRAVRTRLRESRTAWETLERRLHDLGSDIGPLEGRLGSSGCGCGTDSAEGRQ